MYLSKKKKWQRPPLTVEMVVALETLTCNTEAPALDRVIAGFFVLLVFSCGRFSDGLHMQNLRSEIPASASADSLAGYVEADVARTKAAYALERKTMFLPIVAPRNGLSGRDWFAGFAEARQASGVPTGPGPRASFAACADDQFRMGYCPTEGGSGWLLAKGSAPRFGICYEGCGAARHSQL